MPPLGPGTIDDLIADAEEIGHTVTARLITDWVSRGLLDRPTLRPRGRGRGSDKALYSENQRKLLLSLLTHRTTVRTVSTLAKIPMTIWIYYGDDYVPLRQARRAFGTWLGDYRASREHAERSAREIQGQLDNPEATSGSRRYLRQVLADIAYTGHLDLISLGKAARAVFEPQNSPIRRAIGPPQALITVEGFICIIEARLTAAKLVRADRLTDDQLQRARQAQLTERAEYDVLQPQLANQAGAALRDLFAPVTFEEKANACCVDLLTMIGLQLRCKSK